MKMKYGLVMKIKKVCEAGYLSSIINKANVFREQLWEIFFFFLKNIFSRCIRFTHRKVVLSEL